MMCYRCDKEVKNRMATLIYNGADFTFCGLDCLYDYIRNLMGLNKG